MYRKELKAKRLLSSLPSEILFPKLQNTFHNTK